MVILCKLSYRPLQHERIHANEACEAWLQSTGTVNGYFSKFDIYIERPADGLSVETGLGDMRDGIYYQV